METSKKNIVVILFIIIMFVVISKIFSSCSKSIVNLGDIDETTKVLEHKLSIIDKREFMEIMDTVAMKNQDWSLLPLSNKFLEKYNSKDGIFPNIDFVLAECISTDMVGLYQYALYSDSDRNLGSAWQANVIFNTNNFNQLNDIEITSIKQFRDKDGNYITEYPTEIDFTNLQYLISNSLFYDHNVKWADHELKPLNIDKYPCTENYINKVMNKNTSIDIVFNDFFIERPYTSGSLCFPIDKDSDDCIANHEIYARCIVCKEGDNPYYDDIITNYLYRVDYKLTDDKKLDDISVEFMREISTEEFYKLYQ